MWQLLRTTIQLHCCRAGLLIEYVSSLSRHLEQQPGRMLPASQRRNLARIVLALTLALLQTLWPPQLVVLAQEGFVSLDCGGTRSFISPGTGIAWEPDSNFIFTGVSVLGDQSGTPPADLATELQHARYFPTGISPKKNCYTLPVVEGSAYLVRAGFFNFNSDAASNASFIRFQVFLDSTLWLDLALSRTSNSGADYYEAFTAPASGPTLSVCLIRTYESDTPFINSLELRLFGDTGYTNRFNTSESCNLHLLSRLNMGERNVTSLRYPDDPYDRIWPSFNPTTTTAISAPAGQQINDSLITARIPNRVMQTAVIHSETISYVRYIPTHSQIYAYAYWAELNTTVRRTERRIFYLASNFVDPSFRVDLTAPSTSMFSADGYGYRRLRTGGSATFTITATRAVNLGASTGPILNADELYLIQPIVQNTNADDRSALADVKKSFNFLLWVGDPCQPIPWDELSCTNTRNGVRVTSLNLSGKNLSGAIPASIGNFTALISLDLSNNRLTGSLDSRLGNMPLKYLDVSNNQLDGTFPSTLLSQSEIKTFKYFGNVHLECLQVARVPCPTGPSPSASDVPVVHRKGFPVLPITGGAAGAMLLAIVAGVICYMRSKRGQSKEDYYTVADAADPRRSPNVKQKANPFSLAMVKGMTNNFARQIGKGGFGIVYYGVISKEQNQDELAVKVLKSHQAHDEFYNEIDLLSTVHHKNLVSLVGYCDECDDQLILLYEYMSGGNLQERLYGVKAVPPLSWKERLHIALGAARGLEYLHQACKPKIIHRDVKSSNILLSGNLEAKMADFGLSKLTPEGADHISTLVKGTLGYLDPEYNATGVLTEKSDVYSFGVVLLEVLCSQRPITDEGHIISRVRSAMNERKLEELVDQAGAGDYSPAAAWKLAQVALNCAQHSSSKRPDMNRVVSELSQALQIEFGPPPELQGTWTDPSTGSNVDINNLGHPPPYNSTSSRSFTTTDDTNSLQVEDSLSGPR